MEVGVITRGRDRRPSAMVRYGGDETWKILTGVSREERLEERMNTLGRVISIVERQEEERVNTR